MITTLRLPMPITLNTMFNTQNRGGKPIRVKSKRYAEWRELAAAELMVQRAPRLGAGPFHLHWVVGGRSSAGVKLRINSDLSNLIKCMEDALVQAEVIEDDCLRNVTSFSAEYNPSVVDAYVEIRLK